MFCSNCSNCSVCGKEYAIDKSACDEIYGTIMISDFNKQIFNKRRKRELLCKSCILQINHKIDEMKAEAMKKKEVV